MAIKYVAKGATISKCERYRYRLWREWRSPDTTPLEHWNWLPNEEGTGIAADGKGDALGTPKSVLFIMLNPSTADGETDDPTIRRCAGFANAWGYDRIDVVNLFAFRATDPRELLALNHEDDPVGPNNRSMIREMIDGRDEFFGSNVDRVICAWGNHGAHLDQDETMLGWLGDCPRYALKISKGGHPGHPLYLPANSELVEFRP